MYNYPKCPPNYVVGRVLAAEVRTISSSKQPFNITEYLSPRLSSCEDNATSCVFYNPPKELVNSDATVSNINPQIAVNYTCQAKSNFRGPESLIPNLIYNKTTSTDSVTYTLKEITGYGQDWSCTISSTSEVAVRWWSTVSPGSCLDQLLKCSEGNGSDITTVNQNVTSVLCMKAHSVVLIRFFVNTSCRNPMNVLLDIQGKWCYWNTRYSIIQN